MSIFTLTVNSPSPAFSSKASEVAFILGALATVEKELGQHLGNVTSGSIVGQSPSGATNSALGSWSYTGAAPNP